LAPLGYTLSDQTVGNILKRHGIPPAPARKKTTTWSEFIRTHMDMLVATDFFIAEVWTSCGLVTYYVLFFIHLASRRVHVAGMTPHPDQRWMVQIARNVTMVDWGFLTPGQYLIHDRDGKFCPAFQQAIDAAGVKQISLPPRSPNLTAYAERWIRSVKDEALSRLILFGERSLRYALHEYVTHYHQERPHQGKGNVVLMPSLSKGIEWKPHEGVLRTTQKQSRGAGPFLGKGPIECHERLGGLLKYYYRDAA
jgi:putative transposase